MNKILIIGGCGYIGSSLFLYLTEKKYYVQTVDLEWFGNYVNPKNIKKNYGKLDQKFFNNYSVIILLAGNSNYYMCLKDKLGCFTNNVTNFMYLLEKINQQKFIYASSSSIYENSGKKRVNEECDIYSPLNYYDLTKRTIDYYAQLSGKNFYGLRLGTVSGYSPNFRNDLMINRMYEEARKKGTITIHNPAIFRPLLGINDFCRAVESIIKKNGPSGIYNLASLNASILNAAKKVAEKVKGAKIIQVKPSSAKTYKSFIMSNKKFKKKFKFKFEDNINSILDSLVNMPSDTKKSERK